MLSSPAVDYTKTEVNDAFKILAGRLIKNDKIPLSVLRSSLESCCVDILKPHDVEEIIAMVDVDHKGMADYKSLMNFMMGETL